MNWLKHILVVVALLVAALPCAHAGDHAEHLYDAGSAEVTHSCACHPCNVETCTDQLEVEQNTVPVSVVAATPTAIHILFVITETKHAVRQTHASVISTLTALKTVQLLI